MTGDLTESNLTEGPEPGRGFDTNLTKGPAAHGARPPALLAFGVTFTHAWPIVNGADKDNAAVHATEMVRRALPGQHYTDEREPGPQLGDEIARISRLDAARLP